MSDNKKYKVGLFGTCNNSSWRKVIIPMLESSELDYFNPVVANWTPEDKLNEENEKSIDDYLLYVITPRQIGFYSFSEIMDSVSKANMLNKKVIFCYILYDNIMKDIQRSLNHRIDGYFYSWTDSEKKSLEAIGEMVEHNNGKWIKFSESTENTLQSIITYIKEDIGNRHNDIDRSKIIAVDFDETICDTAFPDISTAVLKPYVKEVMTKLSNDGYYIIIWTCRFLDNHIQDVIKFLESNNIPFDVVNKNYPNLEWQPYPKIFYNILIDDKCLLKVDWLYMYEYIKTKLVSSEVYTITDDMRQWYYTRTVNHITSVKKYWNKYFSLPECILDNQYITQIEAHDRIKFEDIELAGYIAVVWNYKCKADNIEFIKTSEIDKLMYNCTTHHVKTVQHHPEFWSNQETVISPTERDGFDPLAVPTIDCTSMPNNWLIEMVCDWCATGDERGNSARAWADKVINTRWKFNEEQIKLIYITIVLLQG